MPSTPALSVVLSPSVSSGLSPDVADLAEVLAWFMADLPAFNRDSSIFSALMMGILVQWWGLINSHPDRFGKTAIVRQVYQVCVSYCSQHGCQFIKCSIGC